MLIMRTPDSPLSDVIDALWLDEPSTSRSRRERILPSGRMQMVVNLGSEPTRVYSRHPQRYQCSSPRDGRRFEIHPSEAAELTNHRKRGPHVPSPVRLPRPGYAQESQAQ
jgi:hypothetical protein